MDISGIFSSIGLGAISGLIGPIITGITTYKTKQLELDHQLEMLRAETAAMIAESDANIRVTQARTEGEIQLAEIQAFDTSIKEGNRDLLGEEGIKSLLDGNWFTKAIGAFLSVVFGLVDFLKGLARPAITYYLLGVSTYITYIAYGLVQSNGTQISPEAVYGLLYDTCLALIYLTITVVTWWFGDRSLAKRINIGRK